MPALLAASTPNGEFSTTIASEGFRFILCKAVWNGAGSGFPSPSFRSSPLITRSNLFEPIFSSSIVSISSLEEPLTTAFKQSQLFKSSTSSLAPSIALAFWISLNISFFLLLIFSAMLSSKFSLIFSLLNISFTNLEPGSPSSRYTIFMLISCFISSLIASLMASAWNDIASIRTPSISKIIPFFI